MPHVWHHRRWGADEHCVHGRSLDLHSKPVLRQLPEPVWKWPGLRRGHEVFHQWHVHDIRDGSVGHWTWHRRRPLHGQQQLQGISPQVMSWVYTLSYFKLHLTYWAKYLESTLFTQIPLIFTCFSCYKQAVSKGTKVLCLPSSCNSLVQSFIAKQERDNIRRICLPRILWS